MALAPREKIERGVLTASAGNMAQGVAYCARRLGVAATVVTPETAPETKLKAVERLGGKIIKVPFETWWRTFEERSFPGVDATFIHAFDDPDVMAGNGTIGLELIEDLPDLDAVVIPWGGGGLTCGIAAVVKALRPAARVYAVEVETAAPLTASLEAGRPVVVDYRPSFVDGIASKTVFPGMLELARKTLLDGTVVVKRSTRRHRAMRAGGGTESGDRGGGGSMRGGGGDERTGGEGEDRGDYFGREYRSEEVL